MADTIPVAQLRAFVERIERIEADIKDLNSDKSEVYKELRGCGFDVKAVRAVVAKRKLDTADREERDAMFDLYWSALNGEDRARAHAREIIEEFDAETGEITDNQESEPCLGHATEHSAYVGTAPDENPTQDDVGATASSTYSHSHRTPARADMVEASTDKQAAGASRPTNSNSPDTLPVEADSAREAPSSSQASPATDTDDDGDDDVPAFIKQNKPDCLKLKDGHCRLSFATSALCAECNQRRAMSRALA